jgi:hypothetical protein
MHSSTVDSGRLHRFSQVFHAFARP